MVPASFSNLSAILYFSAFCDPAQSGITRTFGQPKAGRRDPLGGSLEHEPEVEKLVLGVADRHGRGAGFLNDEAIARAGRRKAAILLERGVTDDEGRDAAERMLDF